MRFLAALLLLSMGSLVHAATHEVHNPSMLAAVLGKLKEGDVLKIHPGDYPGNRTVSGIARLTVEGADPANPPRFQGGSFAWQFSRCPGLTLRHLHCRGQTANGLNLDDGGPDNPRCSGITVEDVHISETGPNGNLDALKCSGLSDLTIRRCSMKGWGGQAIDLVGCQRVLITGCHFEGMDGFSQHSGPQFKGGCEDITLEHCTFLNAGQRPIQAGGSTGLDYFRPPGAKFEARRIIIRNNRIEGGDCACAFTGVDGGEFSGNLVIRPRKWIFRILAETRLEGFPPTRNVTITGNRFLFRRSDLSTLLNIGPGTAPETFVFARNQWLAEDRPAASRPELPSEETGGVYGEPINTDPPRGGAPEKR